MPFTQTEGSLALYRTTDLHGCDCVRMGWDAGDAAPFLPRALYEAMLITPAFGELPTEQDYRAQHPCLSGRAITLTVGG